MEYKVQITDEAGNIRQYNVSRSSSSEDKSLNDFILEALQISEDKRKLPLKTQCPNGLEVYPSIKMKFENYVVTNIKRTKSESKSQQPS